MVHIRKARAGNDSFGNEWAEDDAVVDVPVEQAAVLMAIPDGGFSEAPAPKQAKQEPKGDSENSGSDAGEGDGDPGGEGEKTPVDEAPKQPARRGRKPKADAATEDKTVEE